MSFHSPALPDFSKDYKIGDKNIGQGNPCYIIAEAGSNHNRDFDTALALVDAAADAGCDAVKFQTFLGPDIAAGGTADYVTMPPEYARWGKYLQELYANCALPTEFHKPMQERAKERGICFMSSPFSEQAVDLLVEVGVPALKIASFELVHLPLIKYAAASGLPLIISTGMAGLGDIERALEAVEAGGGSKVALLHCGSNYPLGAESAHLAAMNTLRINFDVPVGYSDHTLGLVVPVAAAVLGANVLEKHFTLDRNSEGPDHPFAVNPVELKEMVVQMREAEQAVGKPRKRRQPEEEIHAKRGRRSLFAARNLKAGQILTPDAIKVVRPGIGLEPMFAELLVGRVLVKDISAETPLEWDCVLQTPAK
ncbi:MAG: N-acetylneuraminate synthase family protein [Rhodospirillales bacterium]|nr:N-acetylneuraminate synthase family protein [Rhodospirillales bacterium]